MTTPSAGPDAPSTSSISPKPGSSVDEQAQAHPAVPGSGGDIEEAREMPAPPSVPPPVTPARAKKTDQRFRQDMQTWITLGAGALFAVVVLGVLIRWFITPTANVSAFASAVIAPLVGLVGPVIGYFFGSNREPRQ